MFKYNVNVSTTGFYQTFYGCNKLQFNPWIFYADGEQSTRFLNKVSDFTQCFNRTTSGITSTGGTAPDLWNCNFGSQTPTKTNCFSGAGNTTSNLTNYNDIPYEWGGINIGTINTLKLEIQTTSSNQSITIPHNISYTHNYLVNYGDNSGIKTVTTYNDADCTHIYSVASGYTITISGTCQSINVNNTGTMRLTIKRILQWGNVGLRQVNFNGCTNLNSLSSDTTSGLTSVVNFQNSFTNCTSLTTIPSDLFKYATGITTNGFYQTFANCSGITSIPVDLFRYNTLVSTSGFQQTFYGCSNLETVPDLLFKYNTNVTTTGFYQTFMGCNKLQFNSLTFYDSGEQSTRFLNKVSDFTQCFYRTSFTGTQGTAPDLWSCNFGTQTPTKTNCFAEIGNDETSISNYADIPTAWGGRYINDATAFKIEITTTTSSQSVTIPHPTTGYVFNYTIDYGDGSYPGLVVVYNGAACTRIYSTAGTYTVRIGGTCESIYVNNTGTLRTVIRKVLQWGNVGLKQINFYGCINLNSIVTDSTSGLTSIVNFQSSFQSCASLTSLPTDLFRYATGVTSNSFYLTFYNCSGLTSLPDDLFRYNTLASVQGFAQTFYNCSGLTTLPNDLFRYNTSITTSGFYGTFYNCTSLTGLSNDLFRYNTGVTTSGFYQTFYGCSNLETVPDLLFKYNVNVSTTGFYQTFMGCNKLQINPLTFYASGETGTRFLNRVSNFTDCFTRTTSGTTALNGTAPDLWSCNFGTQTPTRTRCYSGAGNNATSLINYVDIPTIWKT